MSSVRISNVTKKFGQIEVIHGVDLEIAEGEFVILVGPLRMWQINSITYDRRVGNHFFRNCHDGRPGGE